ncbi:hypothetical protein M3661_24600 [Paenibacillus sp. MER 180]|uniref:hypothetical protein n=1 Tax=Paenibacillus sp. MER 180 TaxID=2939570 RepID=UPI00203E8F04|nr:hypothetical protein [Paenibacillus sp. MER 180]MCM3293294.1 hypothetical protein [Paenibacillus sp. MER 180]
MKKYISAILSLSLFFSLFASVVTANPVTNQTEVLQESLQTKKLNVNGVNVEIVGVNGSPVFDSSSELYQETIMDVKNLISGTNNENPSVLWDPDQTSSERFTPEVYNTFTTDTYSTVKRALEASLAASAALISAIVSKDATTSAIVGSFTAVAANWIVDALKPSHTATFFIKAWSPYYNRSIYKMVTNIYEDNERKKLKEIKISTPLDLVNKNQFRAI